VADEQPQHLLNSFTGALEQRLAHRVVKKGAHSQPLVRALAETGFSYEHDGRRLDVNDYLNRQRVTGLMVIKDDTVVLERCQYGRGPATRFLSASMVKSFVGARIGIAVEEGRIRALDDLAQVYVPELAGNPYGETSIRDVLQMSSGVTRPLSRSCTRRFGTMAVSGGCWPMKARWARGRSFLRRGCGNRRPRNHMHRPLSRVRILAMGITSGYFREPDRDSRSSVCAAR